MRVPSFEVAKCCSMTCFDASKNCGLDLRTSGAAFVETSAIASVFGVR